MKGWEELMNFGADIPFVNHLGFELELFEGCLLYTSDAADE